MLHIVAWLDIAQYDERSTATIDHRLTKVIRSLKVVPGIHMRVYFRHNVISRVRAASAYAIIAHDSCRPIAQSRQATTTAPATIAEP